jgi:hypothetical protein
MKSTVWAFIELLRLNNRTGPPAFDGVVIHHLSLLHQRAAFAGSCCPGSAERTGPLRSASHDSRTPGSPLQMVGECIYVVELHL